MAPQQHEMEPFDWLIHEVPEDVPPVAAEQWIAYGAGTVFTNRQAALTDLIRQGCFRIGTVFIAYQKGEYKAHKVVGRRGEYSTVEVPVPPEFYSLEGGDE